jgi:Zn-dependent M16 (insulinase) family peptidase
VGKDPDGRRRLRGLRHARRPFRPVRVRQLPDPHIEASWKAYEESLATIAGGALDSQTLDLAKIAIAGRELRPMSPAEQGLVSFKRVKYGIGDDLRRRRREWLIACTLDDVTSAARRLLDAVPSARYAVLADPAVIDDLAARHPDMQSILLR